VGGINRDRSDVVALVREVWRVTAVRPASCGGWQRPCVGASHGRSERGRREVVALVREVLRVTAVHPARCGEGNGRAW
jgi:hypothetical protein